MNDVRQQLAAAAGQQQAPPQSNAQPAPGGDGGGFGAFAQAFARCEQTQQCSPEDRQILEQGLPKLVQMAQMTQKILAASAGGQQQAPGGQQQPSPGA